jgi:hypothetical protein
MTYDTAQAKDISTCYLRDGRSVTVQLVDCKWSGLVLMWTLAQDRIALVPRDFN